VVDVLGDHMADLARMIELGDDLVAAPWHSMRHRIVDHEIAAPGFEPCFLRSEIGAELDRFVTGPKAARRAEIGNAAFGRDAGAGKDDRAPGGLDHSGKLVYVITHRQSVRQQKEKPVVKYLHTMIRVSNLDQSLDFFINKLGFVEQRRYENE